jgi:hypothetical protein
MRSKWIQVRVTDEEHAALSRRAKVQGVSIAELVRTLAGEGSLPRRVQTQNGSQRSSVVTQKPRKAKPETNSVSSSQRPQEAQQTPEPSTPSPTQLLFGCPTGGCGETALSPAAVCRFHGRKMVRIEERIG